MNELRRFDLEVHCLFIKVYIAQQKISVTNLSSIKRGKISRIFFPLKKVLRIDKYVFACNNGLFNFFQRCS